MAPTDLPLPQIGRYRLLRKIATGGMAEVFLAQVSGPAGFQKTVALKRILPQFAEDPRFVEMFLNEARLAALLNHPNILQIFDLGEADGSFFIAMEYVDGPNLRTLCRTFLAQGRRLAFEEAATLVSLACEGMAYAHDFAQGGAPLNLVHRDLSPDNLLLSRAGALKIVDFGIAKAVSQITASGTIKGKVGYMPPEQLRGLPLDRRADVFALGVVLYELLSGEMPFEATSAVAAMQAVLNDPPKPLAGRAPGCPPELQPILDRALHKDPEARYPDCRALQADLELVLECRGGPRTAQQLAALVADFPPLPIEPAPVAVESARRPLPSEPVLAAHSPEAEERATPPPTSGPLELSGRASSAPLFQELAALPPEPVPGGPAMELDGQIVGRTPRPAPAAPTVELDHASPVQPLAGSVEGPSPLPVSELELDETALAHAQGKLPSPDGEARPRRARLGAALAAAAALLALAGLAAAWLLSAPGPQCHALRVESTPAGATVRVGDRVLGRTPYLGENDLPEGDYALRIEKDGFETARLEMRGGRGARFEVTLTPRGRPEAKPR